MLVLLDTTVLIDCLRGLAAARRVDELWDLGDTAATSAINVEEVVRGLRDGEEADTRVFLAGLVVLPVDDLAAWQAGAWRREYARAGRTLHQADCLVAATAHHQGARLCTGNPKDFPMPELTLEHWKAGE